MVNCCCLDGALGELQVSVTIRMICAVPRKEVKIKENKRKAKKRAYFRSLRLALSSKASKQASKQTHAKLVTSVSAADI